jgi:hypothetical protein
LSPLATGFAQAEPRTSNSLEKQIEESRQMAQQRQLAGTLINA